MYVISIKRITDYSLEQKLLEEPEWQYLGFDRYSGSFSTGYPCWMDIDNCEKRETLEEIMKLWESVSKNGVNNYLKYSCGYDMSSLAIRKVSFKPVKKLSFQ